MIRADFIRSYKGKLLPFHQELKAKYPHVIVPKRVSWEEVVKGTLVEECLAVSHRWMEPKQPDPDGKQLKAIQQFLASPDGAKIKYVWIDAQSMPQDIPQGSRTPADKADFMRMLSEVNTTDLHHTRDS